MHLTRFALLPACLLTFGCTTKDTVTCALSPGAPVMYAQTSGYTDSETDTVVINWYEPGSQFTKLVRSKTITSTDSAHVGGDSSPRLPIRRNISEDSTGVPQFSFFLALEDVSATNAYAGNDVEFVLPGANRKHTVTNIVIKGDVTATYRHSYREKARCTRYIQSYTADGVYKEAAPNGNGNYIDFVK